MFQVFTDGVKVFDSGLMNASSATQIVNVNVSGKNELRLVVTDGGDGEPVITATGPTRGSPAAPSTSSPDRDDVSPAAGATGVGVIANVTATFSEAMTRRR